MGGPRQPPVGNSAERPPVGNSAERPPVGNSAERPPVGNSAERPTVGTTSPGVRPAWVSARGGSRVARRGRKERGMAMPVFGNIEEYYGDNEARRHSAEADYGVHWREDGDPESWRVSYVRTTGEVYAVRLAGANSGRETVTLLGTFRTDPGAGMHDVYYRGLEAHLDGWALRCGLPGSLAWVRGRMELATAHGGGGSRGGRASPGDEGCPGRGGRALRSAGRADHLPPASAGSPDRPDHLPGVRGAAERGAGADRDQDGVRGIPGGRILPVLRVAPRAGDPGTGDPGTGDPDRDLAAWDDHPGLRVVFPAWEAPLHDHGGGEAR